ncbi:RluA family pseudouridine synthase [Azohydromonas caseinilytica]|uniref:Pseudouridine synthase n=1 Tax=Azohydromonas caseinilytica TaxID=2728836 RepID=A0A848F7P1_9BURK|nr:RluA family pseudouridine synthase [Azohydromonas caseinilytica]NML14270.1 RluA family pseudouridine synthase [Azohydromonas caseinilytica]
MVDPLSDPATEDDGPDDEQHEWREREVDAALQGLRLDKALVLMAGEFSRNYLQGLIERGHVRLDGQVARTASRGVRLGQRIRLELVPTAESRAFKPEALPITVVFEDEHLIVLDKPAGMVVHPAAGNWSGTLLNALLAHHAGAARLPRAGIVHRLDKDTSGLMVVAKTLPAMTALVRAIAAREVSRHYLALAHGVPKEASFTVDAPIGRDPRSRVRMAIVASGKPARTDFEVLVAGHGACALRCTLHSGRTHQIRVHLASRGHPLLADAVYGGTPLLGLERQALHAARLRFTHPVLGGELAFEQAPPADLAAAWHALQG